MGSSTYRARTAFKPFVLVLDKTFQRPGLAESLFEYGGVWQETVMAWQKGDSRFMVIAALNLYQIESATPNGFLVKDEDALQQLILGLQTSLTGIPCNWYFTLEKTLAPVVQKVIRGSAGAAGHA